MKLLFRIFVVVPVALVLLLFAIANRHQVTVSFDPFSGGDIAGPAITAPLFVVLLLTGLVGLLVGGFVVWVRQGRYRRAARVARADASVARAESEQVRSDLATLRPAAGTALAVRRDAA